MVGCPSSLLRYPIIAMAVDYDIKNENYNKDRRRGSDRTYKCQSAIFVYTCCPSVLPAVIYLIYLDNWGRWKKRRETPDSRSPARPNLNIGLRRKVSQHLKQTEERICAIAMLSRISLSQKEELTRKSQMS
jgi:hypothetical protein